MEVGGIEIHAHSVCTLGRELWALLSWSFLVVMGSLPHAHCSLLGYLPRAGPWAVPTWARSSAQQLLGLVPRSALACSEQSRSLRTPPPRELLPWCARPSPPPLALKLVCLFHRPFRTARRALHAPRATPLVPAR